MANCVITEFLDELGMVKEHRIQVGPVVKGKTYPVSELVKIPLYILTPSQNM